jgi:hypothetical protein
MPTVTNLASAVALMRDALEYIAADPKIAQWLSANEPEALIQVRQALFAFNAPLFEETEEND